jgi:hypothetical protein
MSHWRVVLHLPQLFGANVGKGESIVRTPPLSVNNTKVTSKSWNQFIPENRKSTTNARAVRDTRRVFASRSPGSSLSDLWVSRVASVRSGDRSPRARAPRFRLPVSGLFNLLYSVHALGGEKAAPATRMEVDGHDIGAWMILGECTLNLVFKVTFRSNSSSVVAPIVPRIRQSTPFCKQGGPPS